MTIYLTNHVGLAVAVGQVWRRKGGATAKVVVIDEDDTPQKIRLMPCVRRHVGRGELVWEVVEDKVLTTTPKQLEACELLYDPAD